MRLSRNYHAQYLAVLGVALFLVGGCQPNGASGSGAPRSAANGSPVPTPAPDAIKVVTTTTVFADIVSNVGGSRVSASSIIPPGVGPEDYEPKPDDARKLGDADLIVSNGVGLDDFLDRLLANAGGDHPRLVLGDGIPTITVDGEPNPHFWLDPSLVKDYYLPAIVAKLTSVDPGGGPTYRANATAYGSQLDNQTQDATTLEPFHDAFPYFARHYGFELVGVIVENVGQEPSAAELATLVDTVKAAHVKAVFSEAQFNPKLSKTLAQEAGITQVVTTLYNDALGPAPADTYLGLMRWNVDEIVKALS